MSMSYDKLIAKPKGKSGPRKGKMPMGPTEGLREALLVRRMKRKGKHKGMVIDNC